MHVVFGYKTLRKLTKQFCHGNECGIFIFKNEMFYSWGERGFILTDKLQKEQTGTSANSLAGQSIRGPFLSPARRLVSTDRILTIHLAQSRKPAAVGMFAYSGSANICFLQNRS